MTTDLHLFPASAGMNRCFMSCAVCATTVPRVRGDEPSTQHMEEFYRICSPRPRG